MMPVPIHTRAEKYLTNKPFYNAASEIDCSQWRGKMSLAAGESIIGVYQNVPGQFPNSVVVTNLGLHWFSQSDVRFIDYMHIQEMDYPTHNMPLMAQDISLRRLIVTLKTGEIVDIPITGIEGRGLDVISFNLFVRGARQTIRIENRNKQAKDDRATA
jgi:hypothetical protein